MTETCNHQWVRNGNNPTGPLKRCSLCKTSRRCYEKLPVKRFRLVAPDRKTVTSEIRGGIALRFAGLKGF